MVSGLLAEILNVDVKLSYEKQNTDMCKYL